MKNITLIFLFAFALLMFATPSQAAYYRHASSAVSITSPQDTSAIPRVAKQPEAFGNGWQSIASVACGALGIISVTGVLGYGMALMIVPCGIAALVFGIIGTTGRKKLKGLGIVGIVLGVANLALLALALVALAAFT